MQALHPQQQAAQLDASLILLLLAPVFIGCFLLEFYYCNKRKLCIYNLKDTAANLALALMYQASDVLFTILVVKTVYTWIFKNGLQLFTSNTVFNIILLFILQDFLYYWFHRGAHRIRWIWASHMTHHSSTRLNFSTAFRQSMTYPISGMWLFWLPLAYIGFNPDMVLLIVGLNLAFQFFIHTQVINKLGFIEKIFNTPSHHRAHHGTNPQYIDKNYAGIFIIWDKMFGTFVPEVEEPKYGIVDQIEGYNPLKHTFHEWWSMLLDVVRERDLRYLWKSPDWAREHRRRRHPSCHSGD